MFLHQTRKRDVFTSNHKKIKNFRERIKNTIEYYFLLFARLSLWIFLKIYLIIASLKSHSRKSVKIYSLISFGIFAFSALYLIHNLPLNSFPRLKKSKVLFKLYLTCCITCLFIFNIQNIP